MKLSGEKMTPRVNVSLEDVLTSRKRPPLGEPIVWTFHWLKWADSDYLAARYLLLGRMVLQGAVLANTAIEKYLKALCTHLEIAPKRSHSAVDLYTAVQSCRKNTLILNESFLEVLQKTYALRYPDELPDGFNIALNEMKILAQLDRTVFAITSAFKFEEGNAEFVLAKAKRVGDARYLAKNVVLNPEKARAYFDSDCQSLEFRNAAPLIHSIDYLGPRVDDDGRFDQRGAVFIPGKGFETTFPRGDGRTPWKPMFEWPTKD